MTRQRANLKSIGKCTKHGDPIFMCNGVPVCGSCEIAASQIDYEKYRENKMKFSYAIMEKEKEINRLSKTSLDAKNNQVLIYALVNEINELKNQMLEIV